MWSKHISRAYDSRIRDKSRQTRTFIPNIFYEPCSQILSRHPPSSCRRSKLLLHHYHNSFTLLQVITKHSNRSVYESTRPLFELPFCIVLGRILCRSVTVCNAMFCTVGRVSFIIMLFKKMVDIFRLSRVGGA